MATNLGLTRMAEACGIRYDVLRWTQEWYVREETLREASTVIVNHHHSLELARVFGGGTMSSSDGQRFPLRGKSLTGREMVIHGGQVLSSCTHLSDQHSTFGTKVIVPTAREAHYVLDDFLGNATDLPVYEHATDTHGVVVTWTPIASLAPPTSGFDGLSMERGRIWRCSCGCCTSVARTVPIGSTCSARMASRSP